MWIADKFTGMWSSAQPERRCTLWKNAGHEKGLNVKEGEARAGAGGRQKQKMTRKQMKKQGKASLKKHYFIFVAACLIAAFLAAEFRSSLNFSSAQTYEQTYEQIGDDLSGGGKL